MPDNDFKLLRDGFTLIEVLVSIGLIAIVTAVAIPNFRNFSSTQEIDTAASQLTNVFKTAQSSARSGIKCPSGQTATSWEVDLNISGSSDTYTLKSNCESGPTPQTIYTSPFAQTPTSSSTFQAVTDVCGIGVDAKIFFTNSQTTYQCGTNPAATGTIKTTLSGSGVTPEVVVVEPGGIIRSE